jgi:hypothetical protein
MQNYYFIPAPPNEIAEKRFLVDERPIFRRSASKTIHRVLWSSPSMPKDASFEDKLAPIENNFATFLADSDVFFYLCKSE